MKIEITATENMTLINGTKARLWEGVTKRGVKCKVFVCVIAVHKAEDSSQFEKELQETMPPSRPAIDLRNIL